MGRDLAELLLGDEAAQAAAADGEGEPPNPFCVRKLDDGVIYQLIEQYLP